MSLLVAIEGINGSGKSTQATLLEQYFKDQGNQTLLVREPGGSVLGEEVRKILRHGAMPIHPTTQVALFLAARCQLAQEVIKPAIEAGKVVLTDRWITSTLVYQGYAMAAMSADDIMQIAGLLFGDVHPDITFVLKVPVTETNDRLQKLKGDVPDRFEKKGLQFQQTLADGYSLVAKTYRDHIEVDGTGTTEQVQQRIREQLILRLKEQGNPHFISVPACS